ncbi:MAG: sigma 54-interacting transcriptional regulator [Spirochaetes bacterium]|nr:sigma 54-interacting transcriptional regulator [Spirochaetota bacterium]
MDKIVVICGTENTRKALHRQLEDLFKDLLLIESYAIDNEIKNKINGDLIIISSKLILEDSLKYLENRSKIIVAKRVLNYKAIEELLFIPSGEEVLFVNDCKETTYECLEWLDKIGINHVKFIPFYPGCVLERDLEYAITPGEIEYVPKKVKNIIDIGPRLIDISSIFEIIKEMKLSFDIGEKVSLTYFNKILELGKNILEITKEKSKINECIKLIFNDMKDVIVAYDEKGFIKFVNEKKDFLFIKQINKINSIFDIFSNPKLIQFLTNNNYKEKYLYEIRNFKFLVSKIYLEKEKLNVAIFKDLSEYDEYEKKRLNDLYSKGYYAKYTFDDIIGKSYSINFIKEVAKKIAVSENTVLIEGETGTGKELLASAIHNESKRKSYPFVAINFSSLPESLAESELFGYEEGAFTGALKGGKIGLFEQANKGTIFLDEIGDASLSLQKKLLRVLQEKEIMRIGGNKIIPIDVRIIAATNKNLIKLIEYGQFREDLYYRLKVIYIKIPPLRERKDDILILFNYFMQKKGLNLNIDNEVENLLINYRWPGNVRELKNIVEYISEVCNKKELKIRDLPEDILILKQDINRKDLQLLMNIINELDRKGERISRRSIKKYCEERNIKLTEQMIRTRLKELAKSGYIEIKKGRNGIFLK